MRCQYQGGRSAKFEIILTTRCQYWGVDLSADIGIDLPNLNWSWPQDVSAGGIDQPAYLGVDLPNLNSSWPWDVSAGGIDQPADLGVDLPNLNSSWPWDVSTRGVDLPNLNSSFELILTMICQYQRGRSACRSRDRSAKLELIFTTRCQYCGHWSAKFELIFTMRCQYQGVDLSADLGVYLLNLNLSWPQDVSIRW